MPTTPFASSDLPLLFGMPGLPEWLIILVVVLVLFGNRIPGLARSLGSGITEFKKGLAEGDAPRKDGEDGKTGAKPGSTSGDGKAP